MKKNLTFISCSSLLFISTLVSCNPNPQPTPTPTPVKPIDFSFNPGSDNNLTLQTGTKRTISITFNDSEYKSKVKSIEWEIKSPSYISGRGISQDNLSYTFSADKATTKGTPAEIDVKVTFFNVAKASVKTCYIDILDNLVVKQDLEIDEYGYYTYKEEGTFRKRH